MEWLKKHGVMIGLIVLVVIVLYYVYQASQANAASASPTTSISTPVYYSPVESGASQSSTPTSSTFVSSSNVPATPYVASDSTPNLSTSNAGATPVDSTPQATSNTSPDTWGQPLYNLASVDNPTQYLSGTWGENQTSLVLQPNGSYIDMPGNPNNLVEIPSANWGTMFNPSVQASSGNIAPAPALNIPASVTQTLFGIQSKSTSRLLAPVGSNS